MSKFRGLDVAGKKFGRLVALEVIRKEKVSNTNIWLCICDCGILTEVRVSHLTSKETISCGCLSKERASKRLKNKPSLTRRPYGDAACHKLFISYKASAKQRKIDFYINEEFFKLITKQNCSYCKVQPSKLFPLEVVDNLFYGQYIYNGIDRKNNNIGYTIENCIPCCSQCNYTKSNRFNYEEFILLAPTLKQIRLKREETNAKRS